MLETNDPWRRNKTEFHINLKKIRSSLFFILVAVDVCVRHSVFIQLKFVERDRRIDFAKRIVGIAITLSTK